MKMSDHKRILKAAVMTLVEAGALFSAIICIGRGGSFGLKGQVFNGYSSGGFLLIILYIYIRDLKRLYCDKSIYKFK